MNEQKYYFTIRTMVQQIDAVKEEKARFDAGSPESVFFGLRMRELEEDLNAFRVYARRYFAEQNKKGSK